jgi:hypothetical protein
MIETHGLQQSSSFFSRLGAHECERIHAASLEILERVGIDVHDEKARERLVKGGGKADGIRVRLPEYRVQWALDVAAKGMTLCDRNGKVAIRARGYNSYFGGGSDCLNILDHRTGEGILALMQHINRKYGTTFVFSTHDRKVIDSADRLIGIEDGRIRYFALKQDGKWKVVQQPSAAVPAAV